MKGDAGVRAIVLYKYIKGGAELVLAVLVAILLACHATEALHELVLAVRHHVTRAWAITLADAMVSGVSHRGIVIAGAALALDGGLTTVEGWALATGKVWGKWLVVVASGSLLPLEMREFWEHRREGRLVVMLVNLAIVVYLARKALSEHEAKTPTHAPPPAG